MPRVDVPPAPGERDVASSFLAVVRLGLAAAKMTVLVRLVNREHARGDIDHARHLPRAPDEPVVEAGPSDRKRRNLAEELRREDEVVDRRRASRRPRGSRAPGELADRLGVEPTVDLELERLA